MGQREAVDPVARHLCEVADRRLGRPVRPVREEAGDDPVAGRELGHARADRLDGAGPVRHQHAAVRGGGAPARHQQVVEVERGRLDRDPDLAGAGLPGIGPLGDLQAVEAAGGADDEGLHAVLLTGRRRGGGTWVRARGTQLVHGSADSSGAERISTGPVLNAHGPRHWPGSPAHRRPTPFRARYGPARLKRNARIRDPAAEAAKRPCVCDGAACRPLRGTSSSLDPGSPSADASRAGPYRERGRAFMEPGIHVRRCVYRAQCAVAASTASARISSVSCAFSRENSGLVFTV